MSGHTWNRSTEREQIAPAATTPVRQDRRGPAPDRTDDEQFLADLLDESADRLKGPPDDVAPADGEKADSVGGVTRDESIR